MLPAHIVTGQKHKSDNEANSRAELGIRLVPIRARA